MIKTFPSSGTLSDFQLQRCLQIRPLGVLFKSHEKYGFCFLPKFYSGRALFLNFLRWSESIHILRAAAPCKNVSLHDFDLNSYQPGNSGGIFIFPSNIVDSSVVPLSSSRFSSDVFACCCQYTDYSFSTSNSIGSSVAKSKNAHSLPQNCAELM